MNSFIKLFATVNFAFVLFLVFIPSLNAAAVWEKTSTYIKIEVKGLSCPFCAYGLEKKLKKIEGASDIEINIKEGYTTFAISKDKQPSEDQLRKIVKDAGFTAGEITFSSAPFTTAEDDK